jgi:adenylate cyclase, class 2
MSNLVETEVKIHISDRAAILARLDDAGAALAAARTYEHNVRYEDDGETLTPAGIVLRLRQDARARLTYKARLPEEDVRDGIKSRFEAEVTVDDFDTMDLILQRLGYHPFVIYEKYRTTYRLGEVEIVLDEMPFGDFVEIEGPVHAIEAALSTLGLAAEPRFPESYMELFDRVKAALGLNVHDLSFANFEGVTVPPNAFFPLD